MSRRRGGRSEFSTVRGRENSELKDAPERIWCCTRWERVVCGLLVVGVVFTFVLILKHKITCWSEWPEQKVWPKLSVFHERCCGFREAEKCDGGRNLSPLSCGHL